MIFRFYIHKTHKKVFISISINAPKAQRFLGFSSLELAEVGHFNHENNDAPMAYRSFGFSSLKPAEFHFNH